MEETEGVAPMPKPPQRRRTTGGCALEALIVVLILIGLGYLLLPQVARVKEATPRTTVTNHLKQLGIALHTYSATDKDGRLPAANAPYLDPKDGSQKHPVSWRVLILPYIEHEKLFDEYRFDEPWDGPINIQLIPKMPKVFQHYYADDAKVPAGHTHYRIFANRVGAKPSAIFTDGLPGPKLKEIPDGTSNTILIAEAAEAVPWTMPEVLLFDRNQPLPKLGGLFKGLSLAIFADGSVRPIRNDLPEDKLRAWITKDGGEPVDWE